ncbi:hypothetical protein GGG16DRAFT_61534 [Schizophyllum commune]
MIRKSDLQGFEIPEHMERLKATLFADDTCVYLCESDDFATLQSILDLWCVAAKAKFNIGKTEIIPIGQLEYRILMVNTYNEQGSWGNYPRGVHVAGERDAIRILGAFFGNRFEDCAPWTPRVEIVGRALERWSKGISSLEGRRHSLNISLGGVTQFLTEVQGMPDEVLALLIKMERSFFWDDKSYSPVGIEHLYATFEMGGRKVLDLQTRNEAIGIMWLKDYLNFGPDRPMWAYIADALSHTTHHRQRDQVKND